MSHILITFLGKSEKEGDFYSKECYHFEGDTKDHETNFFGLAVLKHLENKDRKADKLVVLGTPSSMWDAFFESDEEVDSEYEDEWIDLADGIKENSESPEDEESEKDKISDYLTTLEKVVSKREGIKSCEMRVIPYGDSQDKQVQILQEMAACVQDGDTVSLDITHGLRHLPMLVILSAMYLEVVKNVTIEGIYYGAREMKKRHDGIAPALNLKGLLGIANWFGALKSFDKDGDYGVFASLLKNDRFKSAHLLEKAAYFERVIDIENATNKLETVQKAIQKDGLEGISGLFSKQLQKRVSWHKVDPSLDKVRQVYLQQRELAFSYLEKRDYTRAIIFALEGLKIRCLGVDDDPYRFEDKDKIKVQEQLSSAQRQDFFLMREIRNQLAHGSYYKEYQKPAEEQTRNTAKKLLKNEDKLRSKLKKLMESLLD